MKRLIYISLLLLLCQVDFAQDKNDLSHAVYYLSDYLVSAKFDSLSKDKNDISKIDILYKEALRYTKYDYSEALLSLTFATLPFSKIKLHVPLFNFKITLPLPAPNDELFKAKLKHTPRYLFFDSHTNKSGDIDKAAHFFGNAFLSYNINWIHVSRFLGLFVESFEREFKIAGSFDLRDLFVNKLGSEFGKALNDNPTLLPSHFLIIYNLLFLNLTVL